MTLDYTEIGKRIARRRKELGLKQSEVEEKADLGYKYLSNIERSISIPSVELHAVLLWLWNTTPDEFLIGTLSHDNQEWKNISEMLRPMNAKQLSLAKSFLTWLSNQSL